MPGRHTVAGTPAEPTARMRARANSRAAGSRETELGRDRVVAVHSRGLRRRARAYRAAFEHARAQERFAHFRVDEIPLERHGSGGPGRRQLHSCDVHIHTLVALGRCGEAQGVRGRRVRQLGGQPLGQLLALVERLVGAANFSAPEAEREQGLAQGLGAEHRTHRGLQIPQRGALRRGCVPGAGDGGLRGSVSAGCLEIEPADEQAKPLTHRDCARVCSPPSTADVSPSARRRRQREWEQTRPALSWPRGCGSVLSWGRRSRGVIGGRLAPSRSNERRESAVALRSVMEDAAREAEKTLLPRLRRERATGGRGPFRATRPTGGGNPRADLAARVGGAV